jgi:hypothetical protein
MMRITDEPKRYDGGYYSVLVLRQHGKRDEGEARGQLHRHRVSAWWLLQKQETRLDFGMRRLAQKGGTR